MLCRRKKYLLKRQWQSLRNQRKSLYRECENAYALVDGETMQCYYRAGFADAVLFLLGWRDGTWN